MCNHPIIIPNKSRRFDLNSTMPLFYRVPCGECEECIRMKRSEWLFRINNEFQHCVRSGGKVIFDTLTYNNFYVPRISDFYSEIKYSCWDSFCFRHIDLTNFFKRLRKKFDFRYIVVSEFGDHPLYSHRPHYHVLFFLESNVNSLLFSKEVGRC